MTADVYAGDEDLNTSRPAVTRPYTAIIKLRADTQPDVLLRIAAQLNLLNCAPRRFVFEQENGDDVLVQVHIAGCADTAIELVCRKLDRLTCVYEVAYETAE